MSLRNWISVPYDGEIEVSLDEFEIEDVVEFLEKEGYYVSGEGHATSASHLLETMYQAYTRGEHSKVMEMMPKLFWETIGKMA